MSLRERSKPAIWIVGRTLEDLEQLPNDNVPGSRPDRSVIVEPMAEFIRFTAAFPGMPTIRSDGSTEWLSDGRRLLQALRLAGRTKDLPCIWKAPAGAAPPKGAETFTTERAERLGSGARLISLAHQLSSKQQQMLMSAWPNAPQQIATSSYGWSEEEAESLPDWLNWVGDLQRIASHLPPILAINGRRPPF